eukprot:15324710-Ditylum_brightwellii.AAC.1
MNFENGKRISPSPTSQPSHGGQADKTKPKAEAEEEGGRTPVVSKKTTSKAEQLQHLSIRTQMPSPSRKEKWGVNLSKALIMSLFKVKDVKKAIRASVSSVKVAVKILPPKEA